MKRRQSSIQSLHYIKAYQEYAIRAVNLEAGQYACLSYLVFDIRGWSAVLGIPFLINISFKSCIISIIPFILSST